MAVGSNCKAKVITHEKELNISKHKKKIAEIPKQNPKPSWSSIIRPRNNTVLKIALIKTTTP